MATHPSDITATAPDRELRSLLALAGVRSGAEWGRRAGVTESTVSRYANGATSRRQYAVVRRLAVAIEVAPDHLDDLFEAIRATALRPGSSVISAWPRLDDLGALAFSGQ
jgi:transcriptional regulator with XRE-family HTH domain